MSSAFTPPPPLDALLDRLASLPGARAVALGGSRATGDADAESDWDFTLYYRAPLDTSALAAFGEVHPPGAWGRIMNGGAWLSIDGHEVDVMLRDLDVVEHWSALAEQGRYEVDFLLSYLAGCPTYSLLAERALGRVVRGELAPVSGFPPALRASAPTRWRYHRDFHLEHARMRAARGDRIGALGQAGRATIEEAHARLCEAGTWVLNEKRIVERAGLHDAAQLFDARGPGATEPPFAARESHAELPSAAAPRRTDGLVAWVGRLGEVLKRGARS